MEILAKRALVIVVVLYLVLISCPGLAHAQLSSTTVTITHPAVGSSVPPTVIFSCTSAALGATVNYYIADVYVTGGRSAFSHSLRTTAASRKNHNLLCNGYAMRGTAITAIAINSNGSDGAMLARATANRNGQFSMNVAPQSGPVRFRASGLSYLSEENGATIRSPGPLSVLLPNLQDSPSGWSINPLTTFVYSLTQGNISRGQNLLTALGNAAVSIEDDYGLSTNPSTLTPLYTEAAVGTDAGRLGLILGAIVNEDQLACPRAPGGLFGALSSDISDGVFDGKKFGKPVSYCGSKLAAIAGTAQSDDALAGLQQLTLATKGFTFGGTNNALALNGVTAADVAADAATIESALTAATPPSLNTFAAISPSMNTARAGATATLLPNGKVLIAGGYNGTTSLSSTELYDPVTNKFAAATATPVMNAARDGATATLLPNGEVLIAGGGNGSTVLGSTELYDPATKRFAAAVVAPSMNTARSGAIATLLPNGKVLIAGGYDDGNPPSLSSTELYDPTTNTFAPPTSTPSMNDQREYATATVLPNGKVLIAGGEIYFEGVLYSAELYVPATNTFAPSTSMPTMNHGHILATATLLANGQVLIAGGQDLVAPHLYNTLNDTELYDPGTNTFALSSSTPLMNTARDSAAATLLPNGEVLIAGGQSIVGAPPHLIFLSSTELYSP
jgi:Galactose oxidase, central domain/Kelch motif